MANTIKIVDLLAQFGLDAGPLIKGLEDTEIRLDAVGARVTSVNALLRQFGEGSNFGTKFQQQFDDLRAAAQLAYEQNVNLAAQEKEIQRMLVAEEREATAQKKAIKASYIAWWEHALEDQAIKEKALLAEEAVMEKRNIEDRKAERARYSAWWTRTLREQEEAQTLANANFAKNVTASPIGQQIAAAEIAMANMSRGSGGRGGLGGSMGWLRDYFQSMTTAQAATEVIGVKMPNAMMRMVSYSEQFRGAMAAAFDVVMVLAFVDILYNVGTQIYKLTRDWEGFDDASIKAWADASAGARQARKDLIDYHAMLRETAEFGLKGAAKEGQKGIDDKAQMQEYGANLVQLREQAHVMSELIIKAEAENKNFYRTLFTAPGMIIEGTPAMNQLKEQGDTLDSIKAKWKTLQDQIREYSIEYGKLGEEVKRDKLKEDIAPTGNRNKLRGPEDHEEPYRLPWYMGPNASQSFANRVHAQRMAGLPSPSSRVSTGSNQDGMTGASATVQVQTTISPQFVFHGVPADIQAFMRDHAEPQLARDIENNTRGIGARVVTALRESGMVVSGG